MSERQTNKFLICVCDTEVTSYELGVTITGFDHVLTPELTNQSARCPLNRQSASCQLTIQSEEVKLYNRGKMF